MKGKNYSEDYPLIREIVQKQDSESFRKLYDKYKDRVYATAYRISGNAEEASDITQDTFQRVFRQLKKFKFESSFSSWLYKVCVNICLDHRRQRASRQTLSMDGESPTGRPFSADMVDTGAEQPEDVATRSEFNRAIQASLDRLGPKLRAVVVLRYMQGLSYQEISEVLNLSMGTVKSRLNRAHEDLKPHLQRIMRTFSEK
jgi:RNA polymerase sigma-70 factor (ECF subfamily)